MNALFSHRPGRRAACAAACTVIFGLAQLLVANASSAAVTFRAHAGQTAGVRFAHVLWHPSKQVSATHLAQTLATTTPASVDLHQWDPAPGYQGQLGSCVTWAVDYGLLGWHEAHDRGQPGVKFNPMYTFAQVKQSDGKGGYYAPPLKTLNVAYTQGNDTQADDPGSLTDPYTWPTAAMQANALKYRVAGYRTFFSNLNDAGLGSSAVSVIENAIYNGGNPRPISIGMLLPADFGNLYGKAYETDLVKASPLEAHEMMADGYDAYGLWVINSWGQSFGINGRIRLSWAVVAQDVFEAYAVSGFAATSAGDTTPPVMGAVNESLSKGRSISSSTVPVSFNWSASDASGIAAYAVYVKTDGGSWAHDTTLSSTATGVVYNLSVGHTYQLAVAAKDGAGNWSQYRYSVSTTPSLVDDTSFSTPSPWARYRDDAGAHGGTYIGTTAAGQTLTYNYVGHDAALIGPLSPLAGQATLYCDGIAKGTLDEYASSVVNNRIVASCHSAVAGQHTIKIVTAGTSGRPWVMMDAFAVLS